MNRLRHCPFCGNEDAPFLKDYTAGGIGIYHYAVRCPQCESQGPLAESSNRNIARDVAINDWNIRPTLDEETRLRVTFALE